MLSYLDDDKVIVNYHPGNPVGGAEYDADDRDDLAFCNKRYELFGSENNSYQ